MGPETDIVGWLLPADDPAADTVPDATAGLIRRLLQFYAGDPVGAHNQIQPAAATGIGPIPDAAQSALITVSVAAIRVRFDGQLPTAAVGLLLPIGFYGRITGKPSMTGCQIIAAAAGAVLDVQFMS